MSSPKFMVFKLKDLRIPIIILLVALAVFLFVVFRNSSATQTFAPSDGHKDGKYIAGITLTNADMDLVVRIENNKIVSVDLEDFDAQEAVLYKDLESGIDYVNNYITATQSLEFPQNANVTEAATLLMDAAKVALSDDDNAKLTTSYEKPITQDLSNSEAVGDVSSKSDENADAKIQDADSDLPADQVAAKNADSDKADQDKAASDRSAKNAQDPDQKAAKTDKEHPSIMDENVIENAEE